MNRRQMKTIRKTAAEVPESSVEELDRLEALPQGTPDEENPEWTEAYFAAAKTRRQRDNRGDLQ